MAAYLDFGLSGGLILKIDAYVKMVEQSLEQAVKAHMFVRRRGSHIFYTIASQMAVRLSALRAGRT
jgi:hypothetical protein